MPQDNYLIRSNIYEENPFEQENIAKQWINSVESEQDSFREREIYPRLRKWKQSIIGSNLLEIGCGQGICSVQLSIGKMEKYIGIEPSAFLVNRAKSLYRQSNVDFVTGNAYDIPLSDGSVDAAFAISVWFHLENLNIAAKELNRVLKPNGQFLIITANPKVYSDWEQLFCNPNKSGKKITGEMSLPNSKLSRNIINLHTMEEIKNSLQQNNLQILEIQTFGNNCSETQVNYFIEIIGQKR